MRKRIYHGWIAVEQGDSGKPDVIVVEYTNDKDNSRTRVFMQAKGNQGALEATEWWDKKLGRHASLEQTFGNCYRVYTVKS